MNMLDYHVMWCGFIRIWQWWRGWFLLSQGTCFKFWPFVTLCQGQRQCSMVCCPLNTKYPVQCRQGDAWSIGQDKCKISKQDKCSQSDVFSWPFEMFFMALWFHSSVRASAPTWIRSPGSVLDDEDCEVIVALIYSLKRWACKISITRKCINPTRKLTFETGYLTDGVPHL